MAEEKKKKTRQLWKLYEVQGDTLIRKNTFSLKSKGDFMADHKDRKTCGKTGYMEKKSTEKPTQNPSESQN